MKQIFILFALFLTVILAQNATQLDQTTQPTPDVQTTQPTPDVQTTIIVETTAEDGNGTVTDSDIIPEETVKLINLIINISVIVFGIMFTFVGYRLFRFTFFLAGLLLGFGVTYLIMISNTGILLSLIVAGGVGLIFGFLFVFVIQIGVFAFGAILGLTIAGVVMATPVGDLVNSTGWILVWIILIAPALLFGIIALLIQRVVMVIGSSFGGSFMIASSIDAIGIHSSFSSIILLLFSFNMEAFTTSDWKAWIMIGGFGIVGIAGCIVQFRITAKDYNHKTGKTKVDNGNRYDELSTNGDDFRKPVQHRDPVSRGYADRVALRDRT